MSDTPSTESLSFEQALAQLEQIVTELERGETPLEATIARFERGVALARRCEDRLNEAERKVAVLLQEGPRAVEVDMESGERLSERPLDRVQADPLPDPDPRGRAPERAPERSASAAAPPPRPVRDPGQMSLGTGFAVKPDVEMDDDDIPF